MRILMTGCTRYACGIQPKKNCASKTGFYTNIGLLKTILERLGHTVDQRTVLPGEDLSGYDLAVLGLQSFHSLVGYEWKHGTVYAATQLPYLATLDDWQIRQTVYSLRDPKWYWRTEMLKPHELARRDLALPYQKEIDELLVSWWNDGIPNTLIPLYSWGDYSKLPYFEKFQHIHAFDPSAFINFAPQLENDLPPEQRERGWVLAALFDQRAWSERLGATWPIVRQHATTGVRSWGRIPESEVVKLYQRNWGVLSPRYTHAGSGWFRVRHVFAAQANAITYADVREMGALGQAYRFPINEIEAMDNDDLLQLASWQRESFLSKMPGQEAVMTAVSHALHTALARTAR